MILKRVKIRVCGKVQGVWFRKSTKDQAELLGLTGIVKNESDGSVYIEAQGEEKKVRQLIGWAHEGPSGARVRRVDLEEGEVNQEQDFEIIYS